jgi:hypothetical protein
MTMQNIGQCVVNYDFLNYGTCTTTGVPKTVNWCAAIIKNRNIKKDKMFKFN